MSNTEMRVKTIVREQLGFEESEVTLDSHFQDDLGADSLDLVELVMEFEKEFEIEIPDELSKTIETVGQAVEHIDDAIKDNG